MAFDFIGKHSLLFLFAGFSFISTNNVHKNAVFPWRCPFQTKLLFFRTIESAKNAFDATAGSEKPAVLHALFLKKEKQKSAKNYGASFFPLIARPHAKIQLIWTSEKYGLKSHLGW